MRALPLVLALAGLGATAVMVQRLGPRAPVPVARPITTFPLEFGGWRGADRPVTDRLMQLLETREVLYRDYELPQVGSVLACIAVAGGNRKVAHPPAICYRGQGWDILQQTDARWRIADRDWPLEVLHIHKDGRHRLVVSWYRVGARTTASYLEQQWWGVQEDFRDRGAPSSLFRFSTELDPDRPERAQQVLQRFLDRFLAPLEEAVEQRRLAPEDDTP